MLSKLCWCTPCTVTVQRTHTPVQTINIGQHGCVKLTWVAYHSPCRPPGRLQVQSPCPLLRGTAAAGAGCQQHLQAGQAAGQLNQWLHQSHATCFATSGYTNPMQHALQITAFLLVPLASPWAYRTCRRCTICPDNQLHYQQPNMCCTCTHLHVRTALSFNLCSPACSSKCADIPSICLLRNVFRSDRLSPMPSGYTLSCTWFNTPRLCSGNDVKGAAQQSHEW